MGVYEMSGFIEKKDFDVTEIEWQKIVKENILSSDKQTYEILAVKNDSSKGNIEEEKPIGSKELEGQELALVTKDVTDLMQAEIALKTRENFLREQSNVLVNLARSHTLKKGCLKLALKEITEAAGRSLCIDRVGVWLFEQDYSKLKCINLYLNPENLHVSGEELVKSEYPNYFQALQQERSIASHDAQNDPRIRELLENCLKKYGITSLLNAPIWLGGRVVGVVSHAHRGELRKWTVEEENFAASVADFVSLALEASQRASAEDARHHSDIQFRAIFENSPIGIGLTDTQGKIIDINPALSQMFGYSKEEVCGKLVNDYIPLKEFRRDIRGYEKLIRGKSKRWEKEKCIRHKNGKFLWIGISLSTIPGKNGETKFLLAMIEDISERKQTELELLANKEAAEAGSQAKSEFLATMSHELRTPLNAIMGLSQLLQQEIVGDLNEKQKEYINCIYGSGEHLLALINDILDLSKVEAGKEDLVFSSLVVEDLCNYAISAVSETASDKGLELSINIDPKVEICIADDRRLKQMLLNLLTNAVKFTSKGKVSLKVNKVIQGIEFIVEDTGIGIEKSQFEFLFEPFKQLDSRLNRQYEGTGLGLALTRKLVKLHGGHIQVESTVNVGSRFTLFLPQNMAPAHSKSISSNSNQVTDNNFSYSFKKILLIEDDNNTAVLLRDYLQTIGYQVEWLTNCKDFTQQVETLQPNLILLDVQLGGNITAWDLLSTLRSHVVWKDLPVIMMTPMYSQFDSERSLKAGASDYLSKPIGIVKLESILFKYLR
jgi:PAS domain S-box-containing protein